MGKITLTVEGSNVGTVASGGGIVITRDISEGDSGRLIKAYASTYAGTWKDEAGQSRAPTVAEVVEKWFDGIIAGSIAHVTSIEREKAAEAAAAAVQSITVT